MKIAVIGSNGFIGSAIYSELKKSHIVFGITRLNYWSFVNNKFDIVINAAGSSKKYLAEKDPLPDFYDNVFEPYRSIFHFKYKKYIYISTVDVEGDSIYGFHKGYTEQILHRHIKNCLILRCATVIGKDMTKGVVFDILNNKPLYVDKYSRFHLITNTAIAESISKFIQANSITGNSTYNIGGTNSITMAHICSILNTTPTFNSETTHQVYNIDMDRIAFLHKLKTSEQYLQDILK